MKDGSFSHSFTFGGSHSKKEAFWKAQEMVSSQSWHDVIAIVPGEHPVYHPDSDE
jgi:hypothetical protein